MSAPVLPPLFSGWQIEEKSEPLSAAVLKVQKRLAGAGDVACSADELRARFALILEPEVDTLTARQMFPLAMVAMGDTLGALTPPQVGVQFRWPGTVLVNAGIAGSISLAMARSSSDADVPDWLIIGINMGLKTGNDIEPGHAPDLTTLDEEGCGDLTSARFIETWCRHFLTWLNVWRDDGFRPVQKSWMSRADGRDGNWQILYENSSLEGEVTDMDMDGNLVLKMPDQELRTLKLGSMIELHDSAL